MMSFVNISQGPFINYQTKDWKILTLSSPVYNLFTLPLMPRSTHVTKWSQIHCGLAPVCFTLSLYITGVAKGHGMADGFQHLIINHEQHWHQPTIVLELVLSVRTNNGSSFLNNCCSFWDSGPKHLNPWQKNNAFGNSATLSLLIYDYLLRMNFYLIIIIFIENS
jgi:hypothetical protein